jgi:anti-sigma factor ChrR (cupin superfamily)
MNCDQLQQLAAAAALGALSPEERARWERHLATCPDASQEVARFADAAAAYALASAPPQTPSAALRERLLARVRSSAKANPSVEATESASGAPAPAGFDFVWSDAPWGPSPVLGARLKVLSVRPQHPYAVLLMELAPQTTYPEHDHLGPEELYVLSGDLRTEGRLLGPGDYLHAEPGTHHQSLYTECGCTALLVVPTASLRPAAPVG